MNRTELFLAIIAYTLVAWLLLTEEGGDILWFAYVPLYVLLLALLVYTVVALLRENIDIS